MMSLAAAGHVVFEGGRHDELLDNQVPGEEPDEFVGRPALFWFRVEQVEVGFPDQLVVELDGLGDLWHREIWVLSDSDDCFRWFPVWLDAALSISLERNRCWRGIVMTSTAVSGRTPLHITNFVGLCLLSALGKSKRRRKLCN